MKCVKNKESQEVRRLSDEIASNRVNTGQWSFCLKSEWKALRDKPVIAIVHTDEQKREISRKADKRNYMKNKKAFKYN